MYEFVHRRDENIFQVAANLRQDLLALWPLTPHCGHPALPKAQMEPPTGGHTGAGKEEEGRAQAPTNFDKNPSWLTTGGVITTPEYITLL